MENLPIRPDRPPPPETMLDLNRRLAGARTGADKIFINREIEATDARIDALVYTYIRKRSHMTVLEKRFERPCLVSSIQI
ncbi:MAG: hypothetical protein RJR34_09905 [Candidatus Methanoculleus thermohydrogenotrophicum]|nr:hypothetical protein [Candidatus Methanoculleus thermohydrogenotrophicum]